MIKTPLDEKPKGKLVLRKTFEQWSAGTEVQFIEYCDFKKDNPTAVLGRIKSEQLVIPIEDIVERRPN